MGMSAIPAAIAARDPEEIRAAIVGELVPVIPDDTDPMTWDPRELGSSGGNVWRAVIWQGKIWFRDDESTVDHDEITCIVLLDDGHYLTDDIRFKPNVLSRILADPPDPDAVDPEDRPQYNDQYRIPSSGVSGDWSGHEDEITLYTSRGWKFHEPAIGEHYYVIDEAGYEHFNVSEEWEDGLGALVYESAEVRPNNLLIRSWAFENQTTNAPPSTGPAGEQYIIGPTPTGAWAGNPGKIEWRPAKDAAFVITAPFVGEPGFDKSLGIKVRWTGVIWQSEIGALIQRQVSAPALASATGTANNSGSGTYSYSATTLPTTAVVFWEDAVTLDFTAIGASKALEVSYQSILAGIAGSSASVTVALFRDNVSTAMAHELYSVVDLTVLDTRRFVFYVTAPDNSIHTYKIRVFVNNGTLVPVTGASHSRLEIKEYA